MKRLIHFAGLPIADQILFVRAAIVLLLCWVRLRFEDVEQLRGWSTRRGDGGVPAERLVEAVRRACHVLPWTTCLVRAITLQRLLSMNGHGSELKIGVGKEKGQFAAHAWLVRDRRVLIGDGAEAESFRVLTTWPSLQHNQPTAESKGPR